MGVADILFKRKKELAEKNLNEGNAYLAENAKREGVISLPSGLQYEIIVEANGNKPSPTDVVTCHYHGYNIKNEVFDSSVERGKPASFGLNKVIQGWTEALQLMSVGSKYRLFLPAHLAYGEQQISKEIGPNSTLIFEVELLGIN